jgi:peroxiredoxin
MRRIALMIAALATFAATGPAAAGDGPLEIGSKAPMAAAEMKNVDGKMVSIAGVAGEKGTLVIFTCNPCPWVVAWESRMVELGNAYAAQGVGVIMINPNDPAQSREDSFGEMVKRAKQLGLTFPYAVDARSDIARAFGATRTPEAFLFDAEGHLVYHGTIDDNARKPEEVTERYLADALQAVVAGTEVPMAQTKALGCTIKFHGAKADAKDKAKGAAKRAS